MDTGAGAGAGADMHSISRHFDDYGRQGPYFYLNLTAGFAARFKGKHQEENASAEAGEDAPLKQQQRSEGGGEL